MSIKILLVEDVETEAELALRALSQAGIDHSALRVDTRPAYEAALESFAPDLVLSDFSMPSFTGLEALHILRGRRMDIPFIFLSGTLTEEGALESLKQGATDYILKSNPARLPSAVQRAITESRTRTAQRQLENDLRSSLERLDRASRFDTVTSLPTRQIFCERLDNLLTRAPKGARVVVAVLDIERFHVMNEALGWEAGNRVLDELAARLGEALRSREALCRIGADVFAFYSMSAGVEAATERIYGQIAEIARRPFDLGGNTLRLSTKYGLAVFPEHGTDAELLLKNAEIALKKAKKSAERFVFYSPTMHTQAGELLNLENRLRIAIAEEQFVLHYQPMYAVDGKTLTGMEALLRWESPELGRVAPVEFIPMLEQTGLIVEAGAWILRQAVRDWTSWHEQGLNPPRIAVNISAFQLRRADFLEQLTLAAAPCLDVEITESMLMTELAEQAGRLAAMRAAGIDIDIDDFGTGYSSLSYIAALPVSGVKVDRSFVMNMTEADSSWKVVSAIIALAQSLKLKVTAEGVENAEQWALLKQLGCDTLQGYLFSRPVAAEHIAALLARARDAAGGE